jgi:valyl-tRNA synthetase
VNQSAQAQDPKNIWLYQRVNQVIYDTDHHLDTYQIPQATRALKSCMDDMSKWYIRTARNDFNQGNPEYLQTLYDNLVTLLHLLAPLAPFITEYMYQHLVVSQNSNAPQSIHLCNFPEASQDVNDKLLDQVEQMKSILEQGFKLRDMAKIKVRQPLLALGIQGIELEEWMKQIIMTEINVKEVNSHLYPEISLTQGMMTIGLNTQITPELQAEGIIREIIRNLQIVRKNMRLSKEQRVSIIIDAPQNIQQLIQSHQETIAEPVGIVKYSYMELGDDEGVHTVKVEGEIMRVMVEVKG